MTFEEGAIPASRYIRPIALWIEHVKPINLEGFVAGWGQSEDLKSNHEEIPTKLKIPIHENEDCWLKDRGLFPIASKRTFCAGRRDGSGICFGDSGRGLSINIGSIYYLEGLCH